VITRTLLPTSGTTKGAHQLRPHQLRGFWARRIRRLLPAVLLLLVATQIWIRIGAPASQWRLLNGQTRAAVGYVGNWYAIAADSGYWEAGVVKTPLLHLWSLAVEEQFYLVWPLLMIGGLRLARGVVRPWMVRVTVGLAALSCLGLPLVYQVAGADRAYYGTDVRIGTILFGAAFALRRSLPRSSTGGALSRVPWAWLGVAWLAVAVTVVTTTGPAFYRGGQFVTGLAGLALVAAIVDRRDRRLTGWLSSSPLVWIGLRSYGMYLWSWPVQVLISYDRTGLKGPVLYLVKAAVLLAVTQVSYHLVEMPIRRGRFRGPRLATAVLVPSAIAVVLSLTWQPVPPAQMTSGVLIAHGAGVTDGLRILVVGDSWARNIGAGLVSADDAGRHTVLNDGMAACGIGGVATRSGGKIREVPAECADWPTRWRGDVATFRPDAVLLVTGRWDQAEARLAGRFVRPDDAAFQARYERQLDKAIAILHQTGAPVYVATAVDNPIPSDRRWSDAMNDLLRSAAHRNRGARLLDVHRLLCMSDGCPSRLKGAAVYDDTMHLTRVWQRRLGGMLLDRLQTDITGSGDAASLEARTSAAAALLPAPAALASGTVSSVQYPSVREVASELLPGMSRRDLGLMALAAAEVVTTSTGETVRAASLRFAEDATPDTIASASYERLLRSGWSAVPLPKYNRAVLVRGTSLVLIVRRTNAISVVGVSGVADVSTRAVDLASLAESFVP